MFAMCISKPPFHCWVQLNDNWVLWENTMKTELLSSICAMMESQWGKWKEWESPSVCTNWRKRLHINTMCLTIELDDSMADYPSPMIPQHGEYYTHHEDHFTDITDYLVQINVFPQFCKLKMKNGWQIKLKYDWESRLRKNSPTIHVYEFLVKQ